MNRNDRRSFVELGAITGGILLVAVTLGPTLRACSDNPTRSYCAQHYPNPAAMASCIDQMDVRP